MSSTTTISTLSCRILVVALMAVLVPFVTAFSPILSSSSSSSRIIHNNNLRRKSAFDDSTRIYSVPNENTNDPNENSESSFSRRDILQSFSSLAILTTSQPCTALDILPTPLQPRERRSNGGIYTPAKRCTAYLVDSTIPPTLVPFKAQREAAILKTIGAGLGTSKDPYLSEALTLNNIAKKTVFGSVGLAQDVIFRGGKKKDEKGGAGYASFVCFGVDYGEEEDVSLAMGLMENILAPRRNVETALGLEFVPQSMQGALDQFRNDGNEGSLKEALLVNAQVKEDVFNTYLPLLQYARSKKLSLLALSPEPSDLRTVRSEGLQSLNIDRRSQYVKDAQGFINLTQDEKFKLYTDRSLLKDFVPLTEKDGPGDYFAERILHHEACASVVASWAMERPDSLVMLVSEMKDVRYMGGINGRIPRICRVLRGEGECSVDESAVTTILLNPSAEETLSGSQYLRLEIGTAPKNLAYQTKVADYIWFSKMPKVNLLNRMMNPM
uniref:Haem-binding uptake Tiki superfamily ChaN domain-containing protein n=1 Tax=Helicotheca tamesis TaxID=374047 RepID=A0A7S2N1K1_9STRA|mmetsp:Transcript_7602/g.10344  ORF Transcript_7602/g.10344 Transcript_7602/m.10344 type:complete len:497 (+) Transcript_7602:177-1667(+)